MSWTQDSTSTTTTDGTLQTLATPTTNASYVLKINTVNMVGTDEIELYALSKVLTGDAAAGEKMTRFVGPQDVNEVVKEFGPFVMHFGGTFQIKRVGGSDRAYKWSLERI